MRTIDLPIKYVKFSKRVAPQGAPKAIKLHEIFSLSRFVSVFLAGMLEHLYRAPFPEQKR